MHSAPLIFTYIHSHYLLGNHHCSDSSYSIALPVFELPENGIIQHILLCLVSLAPQFAWNFIHVFHVFIFCSFPLHDISPFVYRVNS